MDPYFTLDFETKAIDRRPKYPPKPVGFSIRGPDMEKTEYYAFGHPTGNNCTEQEAMRVLAKYWGLIPMVCHNSAFDYAVALAWGFQPLTWQLIHDTMFLIFLKDPHADTLALKESSERILGIPPKERDALKDYILQHIRCKPSEWGAYISECPGDIVAPYAIDDTEMARQMFELVLPEIISRGMSEAYDRERRLMPILLRNEDQGIILDQTSLDENLVKYEAAMLHAENWLFERVGYAFNIDSNDELADAITKLDPNANFLVTPTGRRSVSKESLAQAVRDPQLALLLGYRSRLSTCLSIFMRPWQEIGIHTGGKLYPNWSQVRMPKGAKDTSGAKTARIICSRPNLLNLSKNFEGRNDGYTHPTFIDLPPLPLVRQFLKPDEGHVWCHRDYNSQELRILAHFEDGDLMEQYNLDPRMDIHEFVRQTVGAATGIPIERPQAKTINFGIIYGMGLGTLAERLALSVQESTKLRKAVKVALPGLPALERGIKTRAASGQPIRTWGGREYYTEAPKLIKGRYQTFEYKLLNYLIQGSAADCTKEAIIRYDAARNTGRFLVTVYDEINISAPEEDIKREMGILREVMESIEFDVPMLSDAKTGPTWGNLVKYQDEE